MYSRPNKKEWWNPLPRPDVFRLWRALLCFKSKMNGIFINKWDYVACDVSLSRLPVSLFPANHYFRLRFLRALRWRGAVTSLSRLSLTGGSHNDWRTFFPALRSLRSVVAELGWRVLPLLCWDSTLRFPYLSFLSLIWNTNRHTRGQILPYGSLVDFYYPSKQIYAKATHTYLYLYIFMFFNLGGTGYRKNLW